MTVRPRPAHGFAAVILLFAGAGHAQVLEGADAYGDWRADKPGVTRKISPNDMPAPNMDESVRVFPRISDATDAQPQVPPGFTITPYGEPMEGPRALSVAPNGDVFVSETLLGRIRVIRPAANGAAPALVEIFAEGLDAPFGVAFYPAVNPKWVYVAENNAVKRFAYRAGDTKASAAPEVVIAPLSATTGGHTTRDIAFSADGERMLVAIGSQSNVSRATPKPQDLAALERDNGLGAVWGSDAGRAVVLSFTPEGKDRKPFATGLRNCVDLELSPQTGDFYCTVNERDGLGDNLVPDYVTRVKEGAFYGWPWYYITGDYEDPRLAGQRPDLKSKVTVPDVLFQSHAAPLGAAFYPGKASGKSAFPAEYHGDLFVALHGSQNRSLRIGHTIVRVKLKNGVPTGEYQNFVTGLVIDNDAVLGRPSGVGVLNDGSLIFSDDVGGRMWRVAYTGVGMGRTDRNGQSDTYAAVAPESLIGPRGEKKGRDDTTGGVGSPVQVTAPTLVAGGANTLTVRNAQDLTSLSAARFRWEWLKFPGPGAATTEPHVLSSGVVQGPVVPPDGTGLLSLPASAAGREADALRLIALNGEDNVLTWVWATKAAAPAPRRRVGAPAVRTEGGVVRLAVGEVFAEFDSATGLLRQISAYGRVQTLSGGKLVVARPANRPPAFVEASAAAGGVYTLPSPMLADTAQIDLGVSESDGRNGFALEITADGRTWKTVYDSARVLPRDGMTYAFPAQQVSAVRISNLTGERSTPRVVSVKLAGDPARYAASNTAPVQITTGSGQDANTGRAIAWLEAANAGGLTTARWTLRDDAELVLDYSYALDEAMLYHGVGFDQPAGVKTARALVRAPTLGVYDLPGATPGIPAPQTAGYFADPQWVRLTSDRGALDVATEGPAFLQVGARLADLPTTSEEFPATTLGFMHATPAIGALSQPAEQTNPQGQPRQANGTYTGKLRFRF